MAVRSDKSGSHDIARLQVVPSANRACPRRITREAGQALEILGHAIEYLTDEYVHDARELSASDPQIQAIQLLMALNRQIYYECEVAPGFSERLRDFFHLTTRSGNADLEQTPDST